MERTEQIIKRGLDEYGLDLSEKLGQHFLTDEKAIETISSLVIPGAKVIEIGPGIGHVTTFIAQKASQVFGIEIDRNFEGPLEDLRQEQPNIHFAIADAIKFNLHSVIKEGQVNQVVANLPFHITEPFLSKLIDLPIESAVLLLGDSAAKELMASPDSPTYGKMSLIAQTFFNVREVAAVNRTGFYPQPRTDAIIVELTPKDKEEIQANPFNFIFANIIRNAGKGELVINGMKQGIVDASTAAAYGTLTKSESNRKMRANTRRELKNIVRKYNYNRSPDINSSSHSTSKVISQADALVTINQMQIDRAILNKPFFSLNNQELRELVKEAEKILGQ